MLMANMYSERTTLEQCNLKGFNQVLLVKHHFEKTYIQVIIAHWLHTDFRFQGTMVQITVQEKKNYLSFLSCDLMIAIHPRIKSRYFLHTGIAQTDTLLQQHKVLFSWGHPPNYIQTLLLDP